MKNFTSLALALAIFLNSAQTLAGVESAVYSALEVPGCVASNLLPNNYIHEYGHLLAVKTLFHNSNATVIFYGGDLFFLPSGVQYNAAQLSGIGELLGRDICSGIVASAGHLSTTIYLKSLMLANSKLKSSFLSWVIFGTAFNGFGMNAYEYFSYLRGAGIMSIFGTAASDFQQVVNNGGSLIGHAYFAIVFATAFSGLRHHRSYESLSWTQRAIHIAAPYTAFKVYGSYYPPSISSNPLFSTAIRKSEDKPE